MARATTTSAKKPAARQTAKPAAKAATRQTAKPPAKRAAAPAASRQAASRQAAPKPVISKPSKEDLRLQAEKLERANVTLRKKNRELKRAAGAASERVTELEGEVARLEQRLAKAAAPEASPAASRNARAATGRAARQPRSRGAGQGSKRDPGDAVPPGVAVEQPEPLSEAEQTVLDHLNQELVSTADEDTAAESD
jgi:hypothetical protein